MFAAANGLCNIMAAIFPRLASVVALTVMGGMASPADAANPAGDTPGMPPTQTLSRTQEGTAPADAEQHRIRVAQAGAGRNYVELVSPAGKAASLPIPPLANNTTEYSFLRIRGLPQGFKLTAGFATKNAWLVSLGDAAKLTVIPAPNFEGEIYLEILLVRGTEMARLNVVKVTFGNAPQITASTPSVVDQELKPSDPPAPLSLQAPKRTITPEAEESGLKRAELMLKNSDIAAARMIYETMVFRGSSRAALALGQTFDPNFLALFPLQGLKPDPAQARKWYQQAIDLGEARAQERLSDLGQ